MAGRDTDLKELAARIAIGAVAGVAATAAFAQAVRRLQPGKATPSSSTPSSSTRSSSTYATLAGAAAFGALLAAASPRLGRATGALAGGGLWLAGEMGWLPTLAIRPAIGPAPRGVAMLAGHLAWGWTVAEIAGDAEAMRAALFRD